jgi:hypothetical protein
VPSDTVGYGGAESDDDATHNPLVARDADVSSGDESGGALYFVVTPTAIRMPGIQTLACPDLSRHVV